MASKPSAVVVAEYITTKEQQQKDGEITMEQINKNMLGALEDPKIRQMRYVTGELKGLRAVLSYLWDDNQEAFNILYYMKTNFKEWPQMMLYCKRNNLKGKALVEMFQNESPDGGGYLLGCTFIISKLKGIKIGTTSVTVDDLLKG